MQLLSSDTPVPTELKWKYITFTSQAGLILSRLVCEIPLQNYSANMSHLVDNSSHLFMHENNWKQNTETPSRLLCPILCSSCKISLPFHFLWPVPRMPRPRLLPHRLLPVTKERTVSMPVWELPAKDKASDLLPLPVALEVRTLTSKPQSWGQEQKYLTTGDLHPLCLTGSQPKGTGVTRKRQGLSWEQHIRMETVQLHTPHFLMKLG